MVNARERVQTLLARCYVALSEVDWELVQWRDDLSPNRGVSRSGSVANKGDPAVIDLRPDVPLDRMASSQPAKTLTQ